MMLYKTAVGDLLQYPRHNDPNRNVIPVIKSIIHVGIVIAHLMFDH